MTIFHGDDRRRLIPLALVSVLRALVDDEGMDPSYRRVELRTMIYRIQRMYGLETAVNEVQLAQELAEEDNVPVED